jgi:hypothetical protein
MIYGAELGTTSASRRPFVPTQHVPRRHSLWRRAVLPRRHRLRRRVKGPKMTLKFFRVQTWIFFRWRTKMQKIRPTCRRLTPRPGWVGASRKCNDEWEWIHAAAASSRAGGPARTVDWKPGPSKCAYQLWVWAIRTTRRIDHPHEPHPPKPARPNPTHACRATGVRSVPLCNCA